MSFLSKDKKSISTELVYERWSQEIRRGALTIAILSLIREGKAYGYDIMKKLSQAESETLSIEPSTLYPLLRRLEEKGILEGRWSDSSGKRRRLYFITKEGKIIHKQMINSWQKMNSQLIEILRRVDLL